MDEAQNSYMNIDDQDLYSSTLPLDNDFDFAEDIDLSKVFYFGEGNTEHLPNIFDFGEEEDLSKVFDYPKEQSVNTNNIPSISVENSSLYHFQNFETVSELPDIILREKQPMVINNCPIDENSSRITHQINHEDDDDYSLSYIYSMGLNNTMQQDGGRTTSDGINKEYPGISIPMPTVVEKQGNTNDMILQQSLPKIPILEKFERESLLKLKFAIDQPLKISGDIWKEQDSPNAKDPHTPENPCLKRNFMKSTYYSSFQTLEQEKLMILNQESDFMKPKFFMNNPHGISTSMRAKEQKKSSTSGMIFQQSMPHILTLEKVENQLMLCKDSCGILSSLNNEFQQKKRVCQSNSESIFIGSQISGIATDHASSSHHRYMLNNIQGKSNFCQVAKIEKQNGYNEEGFFGRSSNPANCSNNNFQPSPPYTSQITDGDLLQSFLAQGWNAQDSHFNTTTNWPTGPFQ